MRAIDVAGFERKFRENIDPWDYTNSGFEHFKRTVLLRACGHGKHGRALELGCAIGETTRYLAPLCLRLVALDGSANSHWPRRRRRVQALMLGLSRQASWRNASRSIRSHRCF